MWGVWMCGEPYAEIAARAWSSLTMRITFGGFELAKGTEVAKQSAIPVSTPGAYQAHSVNSFA
jgi:hypothetical protein